MKQSQEGEVSQYKSYIIISLPQPTPIAHFEV